MGRVFTRGHEISVAVRRDTISIDIRRHGLAKIKGLHDRGSIRKRSKVAD